MVYMKNLKLNGFQLKILLKIIENSENGMLKKLLNKY